MKKLMSVLLALCLMLPLVSAVPATAESSESFESTFFANGIAKPQRPIAYYTWHNNVADLYDWLTCDFYLYQITPDIVNDFHMAEAIISAAGDSLSDEYGLYWWYSQVQVDMRVDDCEWMSVEDGWWDDPVASPPVILETGVGYTASNIFWFGDTNFPLYYFLDPGMVVGGAIDDNNEYVERAYFDFDNHSISFRTRYVVGYLEVGEDTEPQVIISPWSDVTICGKDGNSVVPELPESIEAPIISDLREGPEEEFYVIFRFNNELPAGTSLAEIASWLAGYGYLGALVGQMRINGGDWFDVDIVNGGWYSSGVREIFVDKDEIQYNPGDNIELRVRIYGGSYYEDGSPWSNIISIEGAAVKPYITLEGPDYAEKGEPLVWTWSSNAVPQSLTLEVSETGEEWTWSTLKSIGPDAEFSIDYEPEYSEQDRMFRVKGVFEGDVIVYSRPYWGSWRKAPSFTVFPKSATVPNGEDYTVTWDVDREYVSAWLDCYDYDSDEWITVDRNPGKSFTLDGRHNESAMYRIWVECEGYEAFYEFFGITWSGFYFTKQPESESVRIGYSARTEWQTSHEPEAVKILRKNQSGNWMVDEELTALVDGRFLSVPNVDTALSLELMVAVYYEGERYLSDEFRLGWYYMKGDFDDDEEITVGDALTALRIAAKLVKASPADVVIGDIDLDQSVSVGDALSILRVAAKLADYGSLIKE